MQAKLVLVLLATYVAVALGATGCNVPPTLWCDDSTISAQCGVTQACSKSCGVSPTNWCSSETYQQKCGVVDACANYNQTVYGQKLKVTLLYESLCPYCQNLINTVIYPELFKKGQDFITLDFIPYGNAETEKLRNGSYAFTCQHGVEECWGNFLEACVINQLPDPQVYVPFVYCFEYDLSAKYNFKQSAESCLNWANITKADQTAINNCYNNGQAVQLEYQAGVATGNIEPDKHQYVPWILVNDVSTVNLQNYQNDLFKMLCSWYRGPTKPVYC